MTMPGPAVWGAEWGTLFESAQPFDQTLLALSTARARLLADPTFRALVETLGADFDSVSLDAFMLELYAALSTAQGVMLDAIGEGVGLARLSTSWHDTYYRKIIGAWMPCEYGSKSIPKLAALLEALASELGQKFEYQDELPANFRIFVIGLSDDDATLWAQVLDAARASGVQFWLEYVAASPFLFDFSVFGDGDVLAGQIVIG